jgi:hypothetical protein
MVVVVDLGGLSSFLVVLLSADDDATAAAGVAPNVKALLNEEDDVPGVPPSVFFLPPEDNGLTAPNKKPLLLAAPEPPNVKPSGLVVGGLGVKWRLAKLESVIVGGCICKVVGVVVVVVVLSPMIIAGFATGLAGFRTLPCGLDDNDGPLDVRFTLAKMEADDDVAVVENVGGLEGVKFRLANGFAVLASEHGAAGGIAGLMANGLDMEDDDPADV